MQPQKRAIWQSPWGTAEAVLIQTGILLTGFVLEYLTGGIGVQYPGEPYNWYFGIILVAIIASVHYFAGQRALGLFFSSVPNSLASIGAYLFLALLMGAFVQTDADNPAFAARLGLSHLTSSWAFVGVNAYFLFSLALVALRHMPGRTWRSWAFALNHWGLFIALWAAAMGAGSVQRLSVTVSTTDAKPAWQARNAQGESVDLPLAIRLLHFELDEFPPKIGIIDTQGVWQLQAGEGLAVADTAMRWQYKHVQLRVLNYLPKAAWFGNRFYAVNEAGSAHAALVQIEHHTKTDTAWISCGSVMQPAQSFRLDSTYTLVMTIPEARRYQSQVRLFLPSGEQTDTLLEVNRPVRFGGYKLYQLSYDERFGRWSETSVIELVRDPWQIVVYIGLGMMLVGALWLILQGSQAGNSPTKAHE